MLQFLKDLNRRHEELKKRVHSFRIPLSPRGQKIMGFVYFCIPVISGYYIMQVTITEDTDIYFVVAPVCSALSYALTSVVNIYGLVESSALTVCYWVVDGKLMC